MTAAEYLAITRPEDLFPGDPVEAKSLYRKLSRRWHPDNNSYPGADKVFAHISKLYHDALDRLATGRWEGPAKITLPCVDGSTITLDVLVSSPFAIGQALVGVDHVTYLVEAGHQNLVARAQQAPRRFTYASTDMSAEISRYLPSIRQSCRLADGRFLLQVEKTPDLIRLRDVVTHLGTLDAKHVAWIVSSLLNLACYLSYAKIVHLDISPDTYFISPLHHSGALLGGWWYVAEEGARIEVVPRRTHAVMPFHDAMAKTASFLTDLELIRATARESLVSSAPEPMHTWLRLPGNGSAQHQYKDWQKVLKETFGVRKFVHLNVTADAVYRSAKTHG